MNDSKNKKAPTGRRVEMRFAPGRLKLADAAFAAGLWVVSMWTLPALGESFSSIWADSQQETAVSAAWADLDGDGDLDLLIGNTDAANRIYTKNNGVDSYTLAVSTPDADDTRCVVWGDFNGDGRFDFVAANSGIDSKVYLNNGSNAFPSSIAIASSDSRSAAVGDVDQDGDLDIFMGNFGVQNVLYANDGSASFSTLYTTAESNNTESVDMADADNDGDLDLLTGNNPGKNYVYFNAGSGASYGAWDTSGEPTDNTFSVAWGDYNADGYEDILVGNSLQENRVYENNQDSTFTLIWSSAETDDTRSVDWGDSDGDGDLDFVVANNSQNNRVYNNPADGSFNLAWTSAESETTTDARWADFDGDGDLDYAAVNGLLQSTRIYENTADIANSPPTFPALTAEPDAPSGLITLDWAVPTDDHTAANLIGYRVRIGSAAGAHDVTSGLYVGYPGNAGAGVTSYSVNLGVGTYFWSVSAIDTSGKESFMQAEDSFIIDDTSPSDIATVYDGAVAASDEAYATSTTTLSANWTTSADAESGVESYYYGIGSTAGTTDIVGWTSVGFDTSATKTGLSLVNGVTYYFTVKTINNAGLESTPAVSDGLKIDVTEASAVGPVLDGVGSDVYYNTSNTVLSANWSDAFDSESGIARYWYAVGTSAGATDTLDWTDNGASAFVTHDFAGGVANGVTYYFTVKTENGAGLISTAENSDGQFVDNTPPDPAESVNDGLGSDEAYTTEDLQLSANWSDATDAESGVDRYWYAIGTSAGATDAIDWTDNGTATSVTHIFPVALTDGQTYYFSVKSDSLAGLSSDPVSSDGQIVDVSPPAAVAYVYEGLGADEDYTTSNSTISANWPAADSGGIAIKRYFYAIGTTAGATDTVDWRSADLNLSVTRASLYLINGFTYYVSVKAEDIDGRFSAVASSDGILVDSSAPGTIAAVNDGDGADEDILFDTDSISANWSASSDPESSLQYFYSFGSTPGGTDIADWAASSGLSATVGGLSLTDGETYYANVKAVNALGLESAVSTSDGITVNAEDPVVSILSPQSGQALSGSVAVSGSAGDLSLQSWKLEYGAGSSPTAWNTLATGSGNVSNQTLGTWDTSLLSGSYTLKLTARDDLQRSAFASILVEISNTVTVSGIIAGGKWHLASLPAVPDGAETTTLLGSGNYKIFRWDPTAEADAVLDQFRIPANVTAGQSFWIKPYSDDISYSYNTSVTNTSEPYELEINEGWNQVATPFNAEFSWSDVQVRDGSTVYDHDAAVAAGLISNVVWLYDEASNAMLQKDDPYGVLSVQSGGYIYAYSDVTLLFDFGSGPGGAVAARMVRPRYDFLIEIVAGAGGSGDSGNYFGAMNAARDQFDGADAPKPPKSPNPGYTRVYFPHGDWDGRPGTYSRDIRSTIGTSNGAHTWIVSIATDEAGEEVDLSWNGDGLQDPLYVYTLKDLDSGVTVNMAEHSAYKYLAPSGGASEKQFEIVVQRLQADKTIGAHTLEPGWSLIAVPFEPDDASAEAQFGDDFSSVNLYQYYDGRFYGALDADIQAGVGYWMYAEEAAEIDAEGFAVGETETVEIPLKPGWNIIGAPFGSGLAWGDNVAVAKGSETMNLSDAIAAGLVGGTIFAYSNAEYAPVGAGGRLEAWRGYMLKADAECTLLLKN